MSGQKFPEIPQHETDFVDAVDAGVLQLAERHEGSLAVLFDIDHTLVFGAPRSREEYLRAGFEPLVHSLKDQYGDRLNFGVLTTCSEAECTPGTEKYYRVLDPLVAVLDPRFLGFADPESAAKTLPFNFQTQAFEWEYKHIQGDEFGAWTKDCLAAKLILLDQMMETYPDTGFVVVEDLPWVRRLGAMNMRAEGVYIGSNDSLD